MPNSQHILYDSDVVLEFSAKAHRYKVHLYDYEGRVIERNKKTIGVTTILGIKDKSGPLIEWATKVACQRAIELLGERRGVRAQEFIEIVTEASHYHRTIKQEAADIGTQAHSLIERYFREMQTGKADVTLNDDYNASDERVRRCFDAFMKWANEHRFKIIALEQPVYSLTNNLCGTGDHFAYIDDEFCVTDWKSAKYIYETNFMQTAAYKSFYEEEMAYVYKKTGVVPLHPKVAARWVVQLGKEDGEFDKVRRPNELQDEDMRAFMGLSEVFFWDKKHNTYTHRSKAKNEEIVLEDVIASGEL